MRSALRIFVLGTPVLTLLLMIGCVTTPPRVLNYADANIREASTQASVDGFLMILDASSSMSRLLEPSPRTGPKGRDAVHGVATSMLSGIPNFDYASGVRSFGQGNCLPDGATSSLRDMQRFDRGDMQAAVDRISCSGGSSPLSKAFDAAIGDFAEVGGGKSVIVVSDGLNMAQDDIDAAAAMHAATGACIYAVHVGDDQGGLELLKAVVAVAGCGRVIHESELETSSQMSAFLHDALLKEHKAAAADPTPEVKPVGDSDGDGVDDDRDRCPNTVAGAPVDADGCAIEGVEVVDGNWSVSGAVLFETSSAALRPEAQRILRDMADFLQRSEDISVRVEGHTDSRGTAEGNQALSELRARAATDYLVSQGVDPARLSAVGRGETSPTATNETAEGRALNRRVEFIPSR